MDIDAATQEGLSREEARRQAMLRLRGAEQTARHIAIVQRCR